MDKTIHKGSHFLGKLSRNGEKKAPRNCRALLTYELRQRDDGTLAFSACGEVWNHLGTDVVMAGQCVDDLAEQFPKDRIAQRILATWTAWHLNDMKSGTPAQEAAINAALPAYIERGRALDREQMEKAKAEGKYPFARFFYDAEMQKPNWHSLAPAVGFASFYDLQCAVLAEAGMLEVEVTDELRASALGGLPADAKTYRYGTRWLTRKLPDNVAALIRRDFREEGERPERVQSVPDALADFSIVARFIPWSASRNAKEKQPSLNWYVTVQYKGRDILTTDYSAGCAHAPAHKNEALKKQMGSAQHWEMVKRECETGRAVKRLHVNIDHVAQGAAILPDKKDVIHSLLMDSSVLDYSGFAEWAREMGYSDDSIQARETFDACMKHALALRGAVGGRAFDDMREGI